VNELRPLVAWSGGRSHVVDATAVFQDEVDIRERDGVTYQVEVVRVAGPDPERPGRRVPIAVGARQADLRAAVEHDVVVFTGMETGEQVHRIAIAGPFLGCRMICGAQYEDTRRGDQRHETKHRAAGITAALNPSQPPEMPAGHRSAPDGLGISFRDTRCARRAERQMVPQPRRLPRWSGADRSDRRADSKLVRALARRRSPGWTAADRLTSVRGRPQARGARSGDSACAYSTISAVRRRAGPRN